MSIDDDWSATFGGPRYEIKFTIRRPELARARAWVRSHPAAFSTSYPPRQVNSAYFDTPGFSSMQDNLGGFASRSKVRLRWYGEDLASVDGALEIKRKIGRLCWKPQCKVPVVLALDRLSWPEIVRKIRRCVSPLWQQYLDKAHCPTIITNYRREYYVSADQSVRATVDFDQRVYDQPRSPRPNLTWQVPLGDRVIIELKCAIENHERLADVASAFPLRNDRCSKYVRGMQAALSY